MEERLRPLAFAFWAEVMDDLLNGDLPTYLWLYTTKGQGNFVWWSETTDKEPQV